MALLGFDVSHHQGSVDFAAARRAGQAFAIVKATEGVGYTDPTFAANRSKARAAGLVVGSYHFARAGDPVAEADYYCRQLGQPDIGELVVLDWEVAAASPVGWCKAWIDRVKANLGVTPLIYMNRSTLNGFNWSPVIAANVGLWLALYDGNDSIPASGGWPNVAMKQFTSGGRVPGVLGPVDCNVFFGDLAALTRYGKQPKAAPPPPAPEDFMATMSDQEKADLMEVVRVLLPGKAGRTPGAGWSRLDSVSNGMVQLLGRNASIDPTQLAAAIVDSMPDDLARQVADELGKRLNSPPAA